MTVNYKLVYNLINYDLLLCFPNFFIANQQSASHLLGDLVGE